MKDLHVAYAAVGSLAVVLAALSSRIRSLPVSEPLLALVLGVLVGPAVFGWVAVPEGERSSLLLEVGRGLLAVSLIGVGLRFPARRLRAVLSPTVVLVTVGMLAMAALSAGLAWLTLGVPLSLALLIGACVSPTDPVLASSVVTGAPAEKHLPARLRQLLSTESGTNDGLALPLVLVGIAVVVGGSVGLLGPRRRLPDRRRRGRRPRRRARGGQGGRLRARALRRRPRGLAGLHPRHGLRGARHRPAARCRRRAVGVRRRPGLQLHGGRGRGGAAEHRRRGRQPLPRAPAVPPARRRAAVGGLARPRLGGRAPPGGCAGAPPAAGAARPGPSPRAAVARRGVHGVVRTHRGERALLPHLQRGRGRRRPAGVGGREPRRRGEHRRARGDLGAGAPPLPAGDGAGLLGTSRHPPGEPVGAARSRVRSWVASARLGVATVEGAQQRRGQRGRA